MVSFFDALKNFYLQTFKFKGRATRAEFWWVALYQTLVYALLILLDGVGIDPSAIGGLFVLVNLIPNLSLQIRRLHDVGLSTGVFILIIVASVFFNFLSMALPLFSICTFVLSIYLLVQNLKHGEKNDNDYGPNPYAITLDCITETCDTHTSNVKTKENETTYIDVDLK